MAASTTANAATAPHAVAVFGIGRPLLSAHATKINPDGINRTDATNIGDVTGKTPFIATIDVPHRKNGDTSAKFAAAPPLALAAALAPALAPASSASASASHDASIPTPTHSTPRASRVGSGITHSAPIVDATHSTPASSSSSRRVVVAAVAAVFVSDDDDARLVVRSRGRVARRVARARVVGVVARCVAIVIGIVAASSRRGARRRASPRRVEGSLARPARVRRARARVRGRATGRRAVASRAIVIVALFAHRTHSHTSHEP
jgi:hypothetical protein